METSPQLLQQPSLLVDKHLFKFSNKDIKAAAVNVALVALCQLWTGSSSLGQGSWTEIVGKLSKKYVKEPFSNEAAGCRQQIYYIQILK